MPPSPRSVSFFLPPSPLRHSPSERSHKPLIQLSALRSSSRRVVGRSFNADAGVPLTAPKYIHTFDPFKSVATLSPDIPLSANRGVFHWRKTFQACLSTETYHSSFASCVTPGSGEQLGRVTVFTPIHTTLLLRFELTWKQSCCMKIRLVSNGDNDRCTTR